MTTMKKRGRPVGSSRKNEEDFRLLERVADRILCEPTLKPTTALRAIGITNEADQRRLRDKWSLAPDKHIAAARARRSAREMADLNAWMRDISEKGASVAEVLNGLMRRADLGIRRWVRENQSTVEGLSAIHRQLEANPPRRR